MSMQAENNRKLEIGFLESVDARFNTQSYIKIEMFIRTPPAQKNPRLHGYWATEV